MQIDYRPFLRELKECAREIVNGTTFKRLEAKTSPDVFLTLSKAVVVAFTVGLIASVIIKSSILSFAGCVLFAAHYARQNHPESATQAKEFFTEFNDFYKGCTEVFGHT